MESLRKNGDDASTYLIRLLAKFSEIKYVELLRARHIENPQ